MCKDGQYYYTPKGRFFAIYKNIDGGNGVAQYTWGEDCYSGYLLFPTYKDDEYFLLSYSC